MTALDVYFHIDLAGRLERLEHARLRFAYDPAWLEGAVRPLSIGLPLREQALEDEECRPFFAGLLPAHWRGESVLDGIEDVVRDAAERLTAAAAEPA